jgi:fumarate hydratase class II
MPREIIHTIILLKKAAAMVNASVSKLSLKKSKIIIKVCDELLASLGDKLECFPLNIWQSGSGTQTNMNINEVIANFAKNSIHPNDDVNMSQSTNDLFPTAMHMATVMALRAKLLPSLSKLRLKLVVLSKKFSSTMKIGRTHLQDAVPLSLGQEFSGYLAQIELAMEQIKQSMQPLHYLAIGGTAVGTGLNAPKNFDRNMTKLLSKMTGIPFRPAPNKFHMLSSHDPLLIVSGAVKILATALYKIANDIRWLASGPCCGLGELILPANEPGSSIMPGKVNPTQCEMVLMVCAQVIGNDSTISFANAHGDFELNVFKPVIIYNLLQSINLISEAVVSFTKYALTGLRVNHKRLSYLVSRSPSMVTALNPLVGYDRACNIVDLSMRKGISLRKACLALEYLTAEEFDKIMVEAYE